MIRRVVLAGAAAIIAGGAVAAPAAHASIQQPSCWGRTSRCLAAAPAAPDLHYHAPPDVHYHAPPDASPNLKYQADLPLTHYHAPPDTSANLKYQADPPPPVHYHT
jgi:hypothetical protein